MDAVHALLAFSLAAGLLTLTPGLDTALVLRTAAVEGPRPAMAAGLGITAGVLVWGVVAAAGLGALLAVSELGFRLLQLAGAAYLVWLGAGLLRAGVRRVRRRETIAPGGFTGLPERTGPGDGGAGSKAGRWFLRGLATNLLNPKVGMFYVGFLPQFIPAGADVVAFGALLAALHGAMGLGWFSVLTLATRPLARALARPRVTGALDVATGSVLIGFGVGLALDRRL
ncbi:Threonine/homoserine/homoserine lactone efflux protein [Pseudoxanthobacter soli DSM 19599]|uniref:Threonine/homoserine/homoserine lactone efflux protein n=1 Tax=Pseudoxanthobacter soli DSM 19599 TaxID=1123029 RepID=A0A1M7ZHM6_9HYPH|nr:LysE family translocator [Pseudoxanthobacter soli]SHO64401.1 Threonine/homoserine/homoserine lactone efflux protein [Pseudoxanthobacter soli DSM 19599]